MRDRRQVIEGIAWKYRTGSPWREPHRRLDGLDGALLH
jgi:transposase